MPITIEALVVLSGITVAILSWTLLPATVTRGDRMFIRKQMLDGAARPTTEAAPPPERLQGVRASLAALLPSRILDRLEKRLIMAGYFASHATAVTVLAKVVLAVVGLFAGLLFAPIWGLAGGLAGFLLPDLWLSQVTKRRQATIIQSLPDSMDMIAISVEAGLTLEAALQRFCAHESPSSRAFCEEIRQFLRDVQLGRDRTAAYADFGRRSGVHDLHLLAAALHQAGLWGVEMTNVMRIQADHLRSRRMLRAEEQAMKAPIKILLPLVFFIFPAIFVVLLGPAAMQLAKLFPST